MPLERVSALRQEWGVTPDQRVVLLAARLTGWKGQKVLIEAAALLRQQGQLGDAVFVLAGDAQGRDAYAAELDDLADARGVADVVKRVGHCSDMPAAYLAAAVATAPSTEPEAFGRIPVEAQAMGTPVIVSDLGPSQKPCSHRRRRPHRSGPDGACRQAMRRGWPPRSPRRWHCGRARAMRSP